MKLAHSDEGQFWFSLLCELGITPIEWGKLDQIQRKFLRSAFNEQNRRRKREQQKNS